MERNVVTIRFLITISDLQPMQITIKKDHNIPKYSLFCLVVFAKESSRKPFLLVTYRNQVFVSYSLLTKEQKRKKEKNYKEKLHTLFFNMTCNVEMKYNIVFICIFIFS